MAHYFPKDYWTRERVDDHLRLLVEYFGEESIIDSINRMFYVDAAAWFVEQLEKDLDINSDYEISMAFYDLDHEDETDAIGIRKYKYRSMYRNAIKQLKNKNPHQSKIGDKTNESIHR